MDIQFLVHLACILLVLASVMTLMYYTVKDSTKCDWYEKAIKQMIVILYRLDQERSSRLVSTLFITLAEGVAHTHQQNVNDDIIIPSDYRKITIHAASNKLSETSQ